MYVARWMMERQQCESASCIRKSSMRLLRPKQMKGGAGSYRLKGESK